MNELKLRYGINPHQYKARVYTKGVLPFEVLNGSLGYINFLDALNPDSCKIHTNAKLEPCLDNPENVTYQFERMGYFKKDERNSTDEKNVFIRAVSVRDSWARLMKQGGHQQGV